MVCLTSHLQPKLSAFSAQPDLPPSGESGDVQARQAGPSANKHLKVVSQSHCSENPVLPEGRVQGLSFH